MRRRHATFATEDDPKVLTSAGSDVGLGAQGVPNFDVVVDRKSVWSEKHDKVSRGATADAIPMGVADLDFPCCSKIQQALMERCRHPTFGYTTVPRELRSAAATWLLQQHGWIVDPDAFVFSASAVASYVACLRAFSSAGDGVLIMTPLYAPLQDAISREGRQPIRHKLRADGGVYRFDLTTLRAQLRDRGSRVRIVVLCNPHNPGGTVWTREDLTGLGALCKEFGVLVISDEVWMDWCLFGNRHVPMATVAPAGLQVITLTGPGKTWSLAGLHCTFAVILDLQLKQKYLQSVQRTFGDEGSVFAMTGALAAYRFGAPWSIAVKAYVEENISTVDAFIQAHLPAVRVWRPQATYLVWLDFGAAGLDPQAVQRRLLTAGVLLKAGGAFGSESTHYQRMNVGCARSVLLEALRRVGRAFLDVGRRSQP